MPLSPRPSRGMFSSLRPFLWWPFPSLAPAICSKLRQKSISVSLRLIPPSSHVISRYLIQSHPIASYRTIGLAERLNFAAWTRFLGSPASRLATADVRLSCRIHVSTVFDILTHKGRAQPVTGQAAPQTQSEEGISLCPLAQDVERLASLLVADGLLHFSVIGRREICILAW